MGSSEGHCCFAGGIESPQSTSELSSPYLLYLSIGTVPSVANSSISDTMLMPKASKCWGSSGQGLRWCWTNTTIFCHIFCPVYVILGQYLETSPTDRQTHSHTKLNSYIVAKYCTGTTLIWQGLFSTSSEVHACSASIQGGFLVCLLLLSYSADLTW